MAFNIPRLAKDQKILIRKKGWLLALAASGVCSLILQSSITPPFHNVPAESSLNIFKTIEVADQRNAVNSSFDEDRLSRILLDSDARVSDEFSIPEPLLNQTQFWFRVYTEFDSNKRIIHDSLRPQIIYDIVDVTEIMAQPAKFSWLNAQKAEKAVSKRVLEIRSKLQDMLSKKIDDMDPEQKGWLAQHDIHKGQQRKILSRALRNLRVQTGQKNFFEKGLSMSGRYLPGMEHIFREKGLPVELTRLPFVESSFVIGATSKVGAAGIWQFMPTVARQFMLVNDQIDERRNPWKSSEAAARLLKENHLILHKRWGLALTAYNHGPAGVRKAAKAVGSREIEKIVTSYRSKNFDFASANFYTCFLAALYAHSYRDLIWPDHSPEPSLEFESLKLKKNLRAQTLAESLGLESERILNFNPELDRVFKRNGIIPKGYRLFVPAEKKTIVQNAVANQSLEGSQD